MLASVLIPPRMNWPGFNSGPGAFGYDLAALIT